MTQYYTTHHLNDIDMYYLAMKEFFQFMLKSASRNDILNVSTQLFGLIKYERFFVFLFLVFRATTKLLFVYLVSTNKLSLIGADINRYSKRMSGRERERGWEIINFKSHVELLTHIRLNI
jgi:hypothetical protein